MQQVVIKGRAYLNAYYVAKEFGYAPAYLRELYDTHMVMGVFWKGSLYLDSVSWHKYLEENAEEAAAAADIRMAERAAAVAADQASKDPVVAEHNYLHHAKPRRSTYARDEHHLMPQPSKPSAATPSTDVSESPAKPTSTKVPVTLADAETVRIKTVGPTTSVYKATERPAVSYQGQVSVAALYDDEVSMGDEAEASAEADTTSHVLAIESDTSTEEAEEVAIGTKAATSATAETAKSAAPAKPVATKKESRTVRNQAPRNKAPRRPLLMMASATVLVVLALGLASVLFVEQEIVTNEEGVETTWRFSLQAASGWWLR